MPLSKYSESAFRGITPRCIVLEGKLFPAAADAVNALQLQQDWWRTPSDIAVVGASLFFGHTGNMIGTIEWNTKIGKALKALPAGTIDSGNGSQSLLSHAQDYTVYGQDFGWVHKSSAQPGDKISLNGGDSGLKGNEPGLWFGTYYDEDSRATTPSQSPTAPAPGTVGFLPFMWKEYWYPVGYAGIAKIDDLICLSALAAWSNAAAVNWLGNDCQSICHLYYFPLDAWMARYGKRGLF